MTTRLDWPVILGMLGVLSRVAGAQATQPATQPVPEIVPTEDEGPIPEPKVPDDPMSLVPRDPESREPPVRYTKYDYPTEIVRRPLTLAALQAEVSLDVPYSGNDGHAALTQVLRAGIGVTVDLQLGLTYSVGLERLDAADGEDSFEPGKAFSVDGAYTIIPGYLAAQLRLAFYADPDLFGMGVILGLPYKITLGNRWAIFGGADLVRLKIKELAVDPANPAANLAVINRPPSSSSPVGGASLVTGVVFQARPDTAIYGTFGVEWPDFDDNDQPFSLFVGATYSPARSVDLGARVGFYRLDDAGDWFGANVYAALRL